MLSLEDKKFEQAGNEAYRPRWRSENLVAPSPPAAFHSNWSGCLSDSRTRLGDSCPILYSVSLCVSRVFEI